MCSKSYTTCLFQTISSRGYFLSYQWGGLMSLVMWFQPWVVVSCQCFQLSAELTPRLRRNMKCLQAYNIKFMCSCFMIVKYLLKDTIVTAIVSQHGVFVFLMQREHCFMLMLAKASSWQHWTWCWKSFFICFVPLNKWALFAQTLLQCVICVLFTSGCNFSIKVGKMRKPILSFHDRSSAFAFESLALLDGHMLQILTEVPEVTISVL